MIHRDDVPEATVEGWRTPEGVMVPRLPGEPLKEALARAWQHPGVGLSLFAVYPPDPAPRAMPGQSAPAPEPEPTPKPDHAGIGVRGPGWRTVPPDDWLAS